MEIVLDMADIERLLRKGAELEGIKIPADHKMTRRVNNKKSTFRVVFQPNKQPKPGTDK